MHAFVYGMAAVLLVTAGGRTSERSCAAGSPSTETVLAHGVLVEVDPTNPNVPIGHVRVFHMDRTVLVPCMTGFKICDGLKEEWETGTLEGLRKLKGKEVVVYKGEDSNTPLRWHALGPAP